MPGDHVQTDEALMRAVKDGDAQALGLLFDRHGPMLLALGQRMIGEAAGDVIVGVFKDLLDNASSYDPRQGAVKSYLVLEVRRCCLEKLRAGEASAPQSVEPSSEGDATDAGPSEEGAHNPTRRAINTLEKDQRSAIELAFYEGLSLREIAERQDVPLAISKGKLRAGLIKLSRTLRIQNEQGQDT